jgi:RNA polymerase sigma-70 factor (ECF subfamily)
MVEARLDRRLPPRVDPSDVVQEALADAARRLPEYVRDRPLPFHAWLRQFAWERIQKLHRHHLGAGKRSLTREEAGAAPLPDESMLQLANRLVASATSPSRRMMRDELHERVRAALAALPARDREVLVLRYLEGLSTAEVAGVLGLGEGAVKMRQLRALERLRGVLGDEHEEHPR